MRTTVLKENLKDGLGVVERVAAKSLSLPILSNILISGNKNSVRLCATDLEIGITYECLATTKEEGQAVVPAKVLSPYIGLLSDQQVELNTQEQNLQIASGSYRASLKTLDPEDFPVIPSIQKDEQPIEVETLVFCNGVSQVVPMTGQSQARPEISGVFFQFEKDGLKIAGTDSFRLAEKTLAFQNPGSPNHSFILPSKTARELIFVLGERPGKTKIYVSPSQVVFDYAPEDQPSQLHIQLISRLIEGEYPHYQDIIPSQYKTKATLNKNELVNRLRAASIFSGKTNEVRFVFTPAKRELAILSASADAGENESVMQGDMNGADIELAFNWRFVVEGLAQMRSEQIEFLLSSQDGPAVLRPIGEEQYLYVVMPVKA